MNRLLLLLLLLLSACSLPRGQAAPPPAAPIAAPASDAAGTATPALPTRMPTPALPTATPFATPRPQAGIFEDRAIGVRVDYPFYWNSSAGAVPGALVQLANQPNNTFLLILRSPITGDEPLETAARTVHEQVSNWLGGIDEISSTTATVGADLPAWRSEHRRSYPEYGGFTVRLRINSVAHGPQLITLAAYGEDRFVEGERDTLEQIFNGVTLFEPELFGIPRSQAFVYADQEIVTPGFYDPATGQGDRRVFSGLVSLNPELQIQPELAETWAISADGTVYTFYLRPNARFHDGRAITSEDVRYSWERALAPETGSETALTYLGDILGAAERRSGTADTIAGLRIIDEHTVEVTLQGPRSYFLHKLANPPALIVDRANVEQGDTWYRTPNGSGPYRLISWQSGQARMYARNEQFYAEPPAIPYLIGRLDLGYDAVYRYMLGELDLVRLESYERELLSDPALALQDDVREGVPLCTSYVALDTSRPPFDNPQVRQAFALAVDHTIYRSRAIEGANLPARGLFPPGMPGAGAALGATFDPNAARERLAAAGYGPENPLPPLTLSSSGYGFWTEPGVGVLVQMWQETLGASIQIERREPVAAAETATLEEGHIRFSEWCADFADPENFADALFHSTAAQNIGRYRNADVDGLLEQARREADIARRLELYRQAEELIVGDGAAIFLDHRINTYLVAPRVGGPVHALGAVPIERYLQLEK